MPRTVPDSELCTPIPPACPRARYVFGVPAWTAEGSPWRSRHPVGPPSLADITDTTSTSGTEAGPTHVTAWVARQLPRPLSHLPCKVESHRENWQLRPRLPRLLSQPEVLLDIPKTDSLDALAKVNGKMVKL
jgi:hypothetical protein